MYLSVSRCIDQCKVFAHVMDYFVSAASFQKSRNTQYGVRDKLESTKSKGIESYDRTLIRRQGQTTCPIDNFRQEQENA